MKPEEDQEIKTLAQAWTVETVDLTERVRQGIEAPDLLSEIRALRDEIVALRRSSQLLQDEIYRLRLEIRSPAPTRPARISPYAPTESLIGLS